MQPHNKGDVERAQLGAGRPKGPAGPWVASLGFQLYVLDLGPLLRAASGGIALEKLHLTSWLFDSVIMR